MYGIYTNIWGRLMVNVTMIMAYIRIHWGLPWNRKSLGKFGMLLNTIPYLCKWWLKEYLVVNFPRSSFRWVSSPQFFEWTTCPHKNPIEIIITRVNFSPTKTMNVGSSPPSMFYFQSIAEFTLVESQVGWSSTSNKACNLHLVWWAPKYVFHPFLHAFC